MQDTSKGFPKIIYGNPAKPLSDFVVGLDKNRYPFQSIPDAVKAAGQQAAATGAPQVVYATPPPVSAPWQLGDGLVLPNFVNLIGVCGDRFGFRNPVRCQGRILIGDGLNLEAEGSRSICDITIDNRGTAQAGALTIDGPGFVDVILQRVQLRCDTGTALDCDAQSIGLYMAESLVTSNDPALPACRVAFQPGGFPFVIFRDTNTNNPAGGNAAEFDGITLISRLAEFAAVGVPAIVADFCALSHFDDVLTSAGGGPTALLVTDSAVSVIGACLFNATGPAVIDGATSSVRWYNGQFSTTLTAPSVSAALTRIALQNQPGSVIAFP